MKLLVISQYFWPEGFIVNDLVRKLVAQGHEVVVATGKPNYPEGVIFAGYRAAGVQRERYLDKIDVIRVPIWPRGRGGSFNLAMNYLSFVLSGLLLLPWLLRSHSFDAILVFAPSPITQVIPAVLLKWLKRVHLAVWVQDMWPESLEATGFIRNRAVLKGVGFLVRWIYAMSDTLLLQSRAFEDPMARYARRSKLVYFPNTFDLDMAEGSLMMLAPELIDALGPGFNVVFAGNIGKAQAVETLLEAAELLRGDPDIRLVIVGSGSMLEWARGQKALRNLWNLALPGRFPVALMPPLFEQASALLVSLKSGEALAYTVPSKIQAYLAAGRPIIAALHGEGAQVVIESGAGLVCEPGNAKALAACILSMKALDAKERQVMGCCGQAYFSKHFDMDHQVTKLVDILKARSADSKML